MQYINHWPDIKELALPETVSQDLHGQLLQPFDSEASAKEFWKDAPSTIIILDPSDNITQLKESEAWKSIEFTLTYPEYTSTLNNGYQLLVAIVMEKSHFLRGHQTYSLKYVRVELPYPSYQGWNIFTFIVYQWNLKATLYGDSTLVTKVVWV